MWTLFWACVYVHDWIQKGCIKTNCMQNLIRILFQFSVYKEIPFVIEREIKNSQIISVARWNYFARTV